MSTIRIHHADPHIVVNIVATLLEHWDGLTIHIEPDSWLGGEPTDDADHVADYVATEVAAELAARAATEQHPLVTAVIEADLHPTKTVGARERKMTILTRIVGCPTCKAHPGKTCQTPQGNSYGNTFVHNSRRTAYNQSRRVTLDEV